MRIVMFYHSLVSDWNHGNAHFLRGVVGELMRRGHGVTVFEPRHGWSAANLLAEEGQAALDAFHAAYPHLESRVYDEPVLDLDEHLEAADVVLVHEWNEPSLVARIGRHRRDGGRYRLFFHDTHHRAVTDPAAMSAYDLAHYDGVLAFGGVIRDIYLARGWAARAWTWHEAADTHVFKPMEASSREGDLVWVGNWGDGERTRELHDFLLGPASALGLQGTLHGVRYPSEAIAAVTSAGLRYAGWLANFDAPGVFARHAFTVHVPRGPYTRALPGIPTIRPFEALACGIPLLSAPWDDTEGLFEPGADYLVARDEREMRAHMRDVLHDADLSTALAERGLATIRDRHTCAHRVDQFLDIVRSLSPRHTQRMQA